MIDVFRFASVVRQQSSHVSKESFASSRFPFSPFSGTGRVGARTRTLPRLGGGLGCRVAGGVSFSAVPVSGRNRKSRDGKERGAPPVVVPLEARPSVWKENKPGTRRGAGGRFGSSVKPAPSGAVWPFPSGELPAIAGDRRSSVRLSAQILPDSPARAQAQNPPCGGPGGPPQEGFLCFGRASSGTGRRRAAPFAIPAGGAESYGWRGAVLRRRCPVRGRTTLGPQDNRTTGRAPDAFGGRGAILLS